LEYLPLIFGFFIFTFYFFKKKKKQQNFEKIIADIKFHKFSDLLLLSGNKLVNLILSSFLDFSAR